MANPANDDLQSRGREANDATAVDKIGGEKGGEPERYPPPRADDAVETNPSEQRSFESGGRDETATDKADVQGPAGETETPER